jgi:DNA-damage-inducible protein D
MSNLIAIEYQAEAAHNAGVISDLEFDEFQNAGYMGLYNGESVQDFTHAKDLPINKKFLTI